MFGSRKKVRRNQVLNQLAANLPETRWLLLLDKNGIERGSLGSDYVLALGLRPGLSVNALLEALLESVSPLLDELKIDLPAKWLE